MKSGDESAGNGDSTASGLRDVFPGYFLPSDEELREFISDGLVAFDTNALFDIYRFNLQARSEFVAALRLLDGRLWIPNRVGLEVLERRLEVIKECAEANPSFDGEIRKLFDAVSQQIRSFGNRRGLTNQQMSSLQAVADRAYLEISSQASGFFDFDLTVDGSIRGDKILAELEEILKGKIGGPLKDLKLEEAEGARRVAEKIPPGYADHKKDPERAIGDYLVWRQLLAEAASRAKPVMLVTNDQKPDWVREVLGKKIGPRPELVAEMLNVAGAPFHLATVKSFLLLAQKYLGAEVSPTTVTQAQQFSASALGSNRGQSYVLAMRSAFAAVGWPVFETNVDGFIDLIVDTRLGRADLVVKVYREAPLPSAIVTELIDYAERAQHSAVVLVSHTRLTNSAHEKLLRRGTVGFVKWSPDDGGEILCSKLIDELRRIGVNGD
ncbi:hypothetical protein GCM10010412_079970 [Nonomuraea recticatena]|uniref:PIN like domain-containing protein n=1 Tax=Nonomuraea recticatena TaxID=46178 RepID=A0ABN3T0Y0_9ACTN